MLTLVCVAASLSLWNLARVPPGLTHDEAAHGQDALRIIEGARPIYQATGYGREPLYDYVLALGASLGGATRVSLRSVSVAVSVFALLGAYGWVRSAFDVPTALTALALQSGSFWWLSTSRQILRSSLLPALFAGAAFLFWHGTGRGGGRLAPQMRGRTRLAALAAFALLLGATLYTYVPARIAWILYPLYLGYLVLGRRQAPARVWGPALAAIVAGLALSLPMFVRLAARPSLEQRLDMVEAPALALGAWEPMAILRQAGSGLAGLLVPECGDRFLAYNIPGRPILSPWIAVCFAAGIVLCAMRWRRSEGAAYALLWMLVGVMPALLTGATASHTRSIVALPVIYVFPAVALVAVVRKVEGLGGVRAGRAAAVAVAVVVAISGAVDARAYFVRWARSPDVRAAYQATVVRIAEYLDLADAPEAVVVSSFYPQAPHDPYVLDLAMARDDLEARWVDATRALLLPAARNALLIAPSSRPMAPYFRGIAGLSTRETVWMRDDDLDASFTVYDWRPTESWAALRARAQVSSSEPPLPVDYGGAVELVGVDAEVRASGSEASLDVVTLWMATDPSRLRDLGSEKGTAEAVAFTHLLGPGGVVAQEDRLDAPPWAWQPGDAIAQIHRLVLREEYPLPEFLLEVGLYRPDDLERIPVLVNGSTVSDHTMIRLQLAALASEG